jgi:hypothetical protein
MPNTPVQAAGEAMPLRSNPDFVNNLENIAYDVKQLRRATFVLDEYTKTEFKNAQIECGKFPFSHGFGNDDVAGITYMTDHVRALAWELERNLEKVLALGDRT